MTRPRDAAGPEAVTGFEAGNGIHQRARTQDPSYNDLPTEPLNDAARDARMLVGSIPLVSSATRDRLFAKVAPGDIPTPVEAAAFEDFRALHMSGIEDGGDLVERWVQIVHERRRTPRQPGDDLPVRFHPGPETWIATAYMAAADLGAVGAVAIALVLSGTGRRRLIARAASELARAAANLEFDDDDVDAATERLMLALGGAA